MEVDKCILYVKDETLFGKYKESYDNKETNVIKLLLPSSITIPSKEQPNVRVVDIDSLVAISYTGTNVSATATPVFIQSNWPYPYTPKTVDVISSESKTVVLTIINVGLIPDTLYQYQQMGTVNFNGNIKVNVVLF